MHATWMVSEPAGGKAKLKHLPQTAGPDPPRASPAPLPFPPAALHAPAQASKFSDAERNHGFP